MQIDESDEQYRNVDSPINDSLASNSNVTIERELHPEKQDLQSLSTDEGMQIDERDEQDKKADPSIDESREPASNVTVKRDLQPDKHWSPSFVTEEGMQIFSEISVLPCLVTQHPRSITSRRIPPRETKARGKTHPDDLEQAQNAFIPSDL
jgi:hypothetical protein